jgi:hypothetical protein
LKNVTYEVLIFEYTLTQVIIHLLSLWNKVY